MHIPFVNYMHCLKMFNFSNKYYIHMFNIAILIHFNPSCTQTET